MDKDLLYRFFEGHSSLEEMKLIKEWSEASEENNSLLHRERKLFSAMILAGSTKQNSKKETGKRKNYFIREFLKIASIIIITVSVTAFLFSIAQDKEMVNVAMQTITVPAGQRVNISLPDGSNVWLNAGTKMQYPLSFMKDKREVILDGEAYFEVAHNKDCPFIVHTHAMAVEVLGTTFDVEAYAAKNMFEASLISGKIKIHSLQNANSSIIMYPNQRATLVDGKVAISNIDDYNVYRWREGLYCFKNKPFIDIMKDLEKYYDLEIRIEKNTAMDIALTGKFRISDGLDYALRVLKKDVDFSYHRDENKDIIYVK